MLHDRHSRKSPSNPELRSLQLPSRRPSELLSENSRGLMSLIDEFLPSYQFSERHQAAVRCGPGELLDIIQNFQPPRDGFSETAMFVRQLPAKLMHWVAPSRAPRPSPFTLANFIPLARDGDREKLS